MNSDNPNFPDIGVATKTCMASVILNSNPWEQRDLDRKLSRIQTERKRKERTLDWTQRRFYINQVFDQNQNIRFPKLSGNQAPNVPKLRRAEGHEDLVNIPLQADQVSNKVEESPNKREKKKKTKRELSKTKLKGKAKVVVEPDSNKIEEVLNRKAAEICEMRDRNVSEVQDVEHINNSGSVPTLPCINAHRTGSSVYFSRNNIKRHLTEPLQKPKSLLQDVSSRSANVTKRTKFGESNFPRPQKETVIHEVSSSEDSLQQSSKATDEISKKISERAFRKMSAKEEDVVIMGPGFETEQPKAFLTREVTNMTNKILIPMPKHSQGNPQVSTRILERLRWQNEMQQDDVISKLTGTLPPKLMAKANESLIATLGNSRERLISREKEIVNRVSTEDSRWLRLNETLVASGE